jgi:hypothetical protein
MAVSPRDVIEIWDRHTKPPKAKWHVCVCDQRQLFLRIDSDPIYQPAHPILARDNSFLHHDSYVELQQLLRHIADDIVQARHLGVLSMQEAQKLVIAAETAATLSEEHKQLIRDRLLSN